MVMRIEGFIAWILEKEPDKHQMYFALGFINMQIKNDKDSAIADLEKFVLACNDHSFPEQVLVAKEWIEKLRNRNSPN